MEARVFPEMSKPMILGMPWLVKRESTHQLDTLNSGGSAGTGVDFAIATGEFG